MSEPEIFPVQIELFFAEQTINPRLQAFEPLVCYADGDHDETDGPQYDQESPFYREPDHAWSNLVVLRDLTMIEEGEQTLVDLVFNVGTWKDKQNLPVLPLKGFGECHSKTDGCYFWAIDAEGQAWGTDDNLDDGMTRCTLRNLLVRVAVYEETLQQVNALVGPGPVQRSPMYQKPKTDYSLN